MNNKKIEAIYKKLKQKHSEFLESKGVKLPNLKRNGKYTKAALALVCLAQGYPNTPIVSKKDLTKFLQEHHPDPTNDAQQGRHLVAQNGWYILSGKRHDNTDVVIPADSYKLKTLEEAYPGFSAERRNNVVDDDSWEKLKQEYDYKCACCGSEEGQPHRYWKNTITVLQKGHRDPTKPLAAQNIIPQCEKCNQPDRNYWIYDEKGRVVDIANANVINNSSNDLKKEIYKKLYSLYEGKNPEDL